MRILLASSEVHPYSKTGGLADMTGALGRELAREGHQVGIVTPLYSGIRERFPQMNLLDLSLDFALGVGRARGEVWALGPVPGLTFYFVDMPAFFQRAGLYQKEGVDYPDNAERFIFFSKVVTHLALHLAWKPEILHLNDWQTGLAALLLHHQRRLGGWANAPRICTTVHNLAYQGVFPASQYALTNLPWEYFIPEGVEFYGQLNLLKAGIAYADFVTTVSPRYAREILTEELGCGLDGLLRKLQGRLRGILNGVDYDEWNPLTDAYIAHPYSANDLTGKEADKLKLQHEFGLPADPSVPLFGNIGRMVEQKGVDILLGALEEMLNANIQFVQIGNGAAVFQNGFQSLMRRFPTKTAARVGFDEGLSHRIEAGCDFYLMPSRFEPCGLNQLYSLRYATVPIVRATGGLDDTVVDIREDVSHANGIKFHEYSTRALVKGFQKALALFAEPDLLHQFRLNGLTTDFSWNRTAAEYLEVYRKAVGA